MSDKLERFTQRARRALGLALEEAERLHHAHIGTEHLLLALLREEGGVGGRVLRELGLEVRRTREMLERLAGAGQAARGSRIDLTPGVKRALELAVDEARRMGQRYVGTEHLLLGLVRVNEGVGREVLRELSVAPEQIRRQTQRVLQETQTQPAAVRAGASRVREYNLAFIGVGNVGKALIGLLHRKRDELRRDHRIQWRITGLASRRLGWLVNQDGFDVDALVAGNYQAPLTAADVRAWLKAAHAHVLFENSSLDPYTGQPAIDYITAALEYGAHVITANKGPVVHAYHELRDLAKSKGKQFLFEATVMGGTPIFSLFREALPAANLKRFRGILNSTTNLILSEMEQGSSFEQAVKKAQELGIAETDPSFDVDGWDAAVKVSALATVLMDFPLKPQDVEREGIRGLTQEMVQTARAAGRPFKLVCAAESGAEGRVTASVRPEQVAASDPLASVNGPNAIVTFEMDTLHSLTLSEQHPDAVTTAYGPLADFISLVRAEK
jgi:homoserine dehydrogenase